MNNHSKSAIICVAAIILTILTTLSVEHLIQRINGKTPKQIEQYYKTQQAIEQYNKAVNKECQWYKEKLDSFKKPTVNYGPPED